MNSQNTFKYTELFSIIPVLRKENLITDAEKNSIKEYVIKNKPDLSKEFEEFNTDNDKNKLAKALKEKALPKSVPKPNSNPNPNQEGNKFRRGNRKNFQTTVLTSKPGLKLANFRFHVDDTDLIGSPKIFFNNIVEEEKEEDKE